MKRLTVLAFGVLFVALKLTDKIDWSWWLVLAPLWVPHAIIALGTGMQAFLWWSMTPQQRALEKFRATVEALGKRHQ